MTPGQITTEPRSLPKGKKFSGVLELLGDICITRPSLNVGQLSVLVFKWLNSVFFQYLFCFS